MNTKNIFYVALFFVLGIYSIKAAELPLDAQMFEAISKKNLETVKKLVEQGAKADYKPLGQHGPPLAEAARENSASIVEYLLSKGALIDQRNISNRTPLMIALQSNAPDVVNVLLQHGANVNATDGLSSTPLMLAAAYSEVPQVNIIKDLITRGAQINIQDNEGMTPLLYAVKTGNTPVVKYLLTLPTIDIHAKNKQGQTALALAYEGFEKTNTDRYKEIGRMLVQHLGITGPEGRISKTGIQQKQLPEDILKYIATFL